MVDNMFNVNFNEFDRDLTLELFKFCTPDSIRNCADTFKKYQIVVSNQFKFAMRFSKNFEMRVKCRTELRKFYKKLTHSSKEIPEYICTRDKRTDTEGYFMKIRVIVSDREFEVHYYSMKNNSASVEKRLIDFFKYREGDEFDDINNLEKGANLDPNFQRKVLLNRLASSKHTFFKSHGPLVFYFFFKGDMYFVDTAVEGKLMPDYKGPDYDKSVAVVFGNTNEFDEYIQKDGRYAFDRSNCYVYFENLGYKNENVKIFYDKIINISDLINMLI
jgi:hypothetical protein